MVVKAWSDIPEEMIAKSFQICGQTRDAKPEDVTCMKEGHPASGALAEVKKFWDYTAEDFAAEDTVPIEMVEEIDEEEDLTAIEEDSDMEDEEIID